MGDTTAFEDGFAGTGGTDTSEPTPPGGPGGPDTSTGKHAMLLVPDFANAAASGGSVAPMSSYLRLGAAHSDGGNFHRKDLGEDLAALVQGFTDDTRARQDFTPDIPAHAEGGLAGWPVVVVPDQPPRELNSSPDEFNSNPPNVTEASLHTTVARRLESTLIHTKGGWRDHSDGNRITTTRGDKVEVIRGNYKLVVLGRSPVPTRPDAGWDNATGFELAGGNVDASGADLAFGMLPDVPGPTATDPSRTIALETTFVWNKNLDGVTWGWKQTTNVGKEGDLNNGQIITNTFVDRQVTNLGSAVTPVQEIISSTFAKTITSSTDAHIITSSTVAGMSVSSTTSAPTVNTATAALLQSTTQAIGANFVGNAMGATLEADVAGLIALVQACGAIVSLQAAGAIVNDQIAATMINIMTGMSVDTHAGVHVDNHPGVHLDNHAGSHVDLHAGTHVVFDSTPAPIALVIGTPTQITGGMSVTLNNGVATINGANNVEVATTHFTL